MSRRFRQPSNPAYRNPSRRTEHTASHAPNAGLTGRARFDGRCAICGQHKTAAELRRLCSGLVWRSVCLRCLPDGHPERSGESAR